MRNDQIFVLLLVIILPMSGCFDGAVGDAEGTDDATDGATVINNYHNNTTIVYNNTTTDVGPEYFVVGGTVDETTTNEPRTGGGINYYPFNFSTTSGQTVYLHSLVVDGNNEYAYLNSDCGEGGQWSVTSTSTDSYSDHLGYWIAGSAFDCQHSVTILGSINSNSQPPFHFSAIYSIEEMTAVPV